MHACRLPAPTPPAHLLSFAVLSPLYLSHSSQIRCGFLEYSFGLINSWCSAPQLFSACEYENTAHWIWLGEL
ncbi:hypothetical protein ACTXT7_011112 [Hymenolepis weldensis]